MKNQTSSLPPELPVALPQGRKLVSIIVVTYQAVDALERAIQSVLSQQPIYEFIIIDGGSTDGTLAVIKAYEEVLDYWVSEPDSGIYEAMNKGISKATGKWVYFLGADDQLTPNILTTLEPLLLSQNRSLVFGNIQYESGKLFRSSIGLKTYLCNTVHHQGAFYSRYLFSFFKYDDSLKIIADYELNLYIYTNDIPQIYVNSLIAFCTSGGSSFNIELALSETNAVRKRFVRPMINDLLKNLLVLKYFVVKMWNNKTKYQT